MLVTANQARTSLAITAAGVAVIAALLLTPRSVPDGCCTQSSDILKVRLTSRHVLAGAQDIAVTITMPSAHVHVRPPLSLAIVLDRSGSMEGAPLANAKAAAARLVDQLDERDAFSIISYSSAAETVVPMTHATASRKQAARAALDGIWSDGSTCISCGIEQGANELAATPVAGGVRRMVLISDGQANAGVWDRGELADLATQTAATGVSISTVGVGLDFDEMTMTRLADVGHGHYYFVEDTARLGQMFADELGGLANTVASDTRLVITPGAGVSIDEAYGYPLIRTGDVVTIPIADLRTGETRKVVLHTTIQSELGPLAVAHVRLHWRRPSDGVLARADAQLATTIVSDAADAAATIDREAVNIVEQGRTARVLEQATITYEQQGAEAAQKVLERHVREVRANKNLDAPAMQAIESASEGAIGDFATAPAPKAMKTTRANAYKLAH